MTRDGADVALTRTEFDLLAELARHPGQVFTREVLLDRVWGYDYLGDSRLVDVAIGRLRAKVEADPASPPLVLTVRGAGYKAARPAALSAPVRIGIRDPRRAHARRARRGHGRGDRARASTRSSTRRSATGSSPTRASRSTTTSRSCCPARTRRRPTPRASGPAACRTRSRCAASG